MTSAGATLIERRHSFREWLFSDWTHRLIAYGVAVLSLSLIVQVVATVLIGGR